MNAVRFSACIAVIIISAIAVEAQDSVQLKSHEAEGIAIALKILESSTPKDKRAASIYRRLRSYRVDVDRQDGRFVVAFVPGDDLNDDHTALEGHFLFQREPLDLIKVNYGR